jgi:hypothetical protein
VNRPKDHDLKHPLRYIPPGGAPGFNRASRTLDALRLAGADARMFNADLKRVLRQRHNLKLKETK